MDAVPRRRHDGDAGIASSLCVVDGNPAISYYTGFPNKDTMYVRAADETGSSWGNPVIIDANIDYVIGNFIDSSLRWSTACR